MAVAVAADMAAAAADTEGLAEVLRETRGILSDRSKAAVAAIDVEAAHMVDRGVVVPEVVVPEAADQGVDSPGPKLPFKPSRVFMEMI